MPMAAACGRVKENQATVQRQRPSTAGEDTELRRRAEQQVRIRQQVVSKSVIAPTPIKMTSGATPEPIATL